MKKILIILSLLLLLAGCGAVDSEKESEKIQEPYREPVIWTDKETRCDYLIVDTDSFQGGVSITPRMNADGTQFCN